MDRLSASYPIQTSFNRGEISPLLASRPDIEHWASSLSLCTNLTPLVQGGLRRRSGTRFVAEVANSAVRSRLIPFVFSADQTYVLELSEAGAIRFVADRAQVVLNGAPYQIQHSWGADVHRLSTVQANDLIYAAHRNHPIRRITRRSETDWTIVDHVMKDGPYLDDNRTRTTLVLSDRGTIHGIHAGAVSNKSTVSALRGNAAILFNTNLNDKYETPDPAGIVTVTPNVPRVANKYWVACGKNKDDAPQAWTFEGFDGQAWVVLDTRTAESGWTQAQKRFYEFDNKIPYQAYRFYWTAQNFPNADVPDTRFAEININEDGDAMDPFLVEATGTDGINGGAGFQPSDVGRSISFVGPDEKKRYLTITSVVDATRFYVRMYGFGLNDVGTRITRFKLGAFSDSSGWPQAISLYKERLMFAGTASKPVTIYGSKQGIFDDAGTAQDVLATDGLAITLLSSQMNRIEWLVDDEDLLAGSVGQIRGVGPADVTSGFSARNIDQTKGPTNGASPVQPLSIGGITLYVSSDTRKIRELVLGDQNRYVAPELSVLAEHLLKAGIREWTYVESPDPVIWICLENGDLVSVTYDRDQKVTAFARQQIGGGFVESVTSIPGRDRQGMVYLVVRRMIAGQTRRYVEVLEPAWDGTRQDLTEARFLDSHLVYQGPPVRTVQGLSHLEGQTVGVLADETEVLEPLTVTGGAVTIPFAASRIVVGRRYESIMRTLPISTVGGDGTIFGRRRTVTGGHVDLMKSAGQIQVGNAFGMTDIQPDASNDLFGSSAEVFDGFQRIEIEGSWAEGGGQVTVRTDSPLPMLVRSIVLRVEGEP